VKYVGGQWAWGGGCQMSGGFQFGGCCGCFSESRMSGYRDTKRGKGYTKVLTYVEYRAVSCVFQNIDPPPPSPASGGVNILEDHSHRIGLLQYNLSTGYRRVWMGDMAHKVSVCAWRVQWVEEGVSKQWGTREGGCVGVGE
jgi:hypothetical protein